MERDFGEYAISVVELLSDLKKYKQGRSRLALKRNTEPKHAFITRLILDKIEQIKFEKSATNYGHFIIQFEDVLNRNFPREVLNNFYDNLSTIVITAVGFQLGDFKDYPRFLGRYCFTENSICIDKKKDEKMLSVYHELFHMASTNRMGEKVASGFTYFKNDMSSIGRLLNEGYTELLTSRYFFNSEYDMAYDPEYKYAYLIEILVGKENMENLYLKADLKGLVKLLERYHSTEDVMNFLKEMDSLRNNDPIQVKAVRLTNITSFLIESYVRKKVMDGEKITNKQTMDDIFNYAKIIPTHVDLPKSSHNVPVESLTYEIVEETINQINYGRVARH